jgi:prepilin-type N-terminal cleavage/methylation domain-containing protein
MRNRRSGFTLIELAMSAAVLSLAIVATTDLVMTTGDTLAIGVSMSNLDAKANALLGRIERELIQAGADTLLPATPAGDSALSYRLAFGYEEEAVQWGSRARIELRPDEAQDGVDNDDDRFVDEARVVLVRNPDTAAETETDWGRGIRSYLEGEVPNGLDDNGNGLVDERGLCFALDGDSIVIRLSVEGRDTKGRILVRTVTTAVRPRN